MEVGKHSKETEEEIIKKPVGLGLHTIRKGFERDIKETISKVISGSLRSGNRIEYEGSIILLGDINAGAEVIAEENIIVFGTIRGLAHAGANGNRKAIIVANEIAAPQLRIADIVKEIERPRYYDEDEDDTERREIEDDFDFDDEIKTRAYVKDNEIVLE